MKTRVYEGVETPVLRDVPEPRPAPGEELVLIEVAGIFGSDMHAFLGHDERRPAPLSLGIQRMTLQEITLIETDTYSVHDFRDTALAVFDGHLGALDRFGTRASAAGPDAFRDLRGQKVAAPKIMRIPLS